MKQTKKIKLKNCPLCGSERLVFFLETKDYFLTNEKFTLDRCLSCSFVFTNPRPVEEELSKYYKSPDYLSHTVRKRNLKDLIYRFLRRINIRRKYQLIKRFKTGKTIMDIGSGTGELLSYFKKNGWTVTGIEPNQEARTYAVKKNKIDVFDVNKLESIEDERFDIITLWHVLEHISNLNETLKQIKGKLKSDGYCIIAVPNIDSTDFEYYRDKWAALDVPRHLYHFSPETIRFLLNNNGFEVVYTEPMLFDAYYVSLLSETYLKKKIPSIYALINGFRSNLKARKKKNYSSIIFVATQK